MATALVKSLEEFLAFAVWISVFIVVKITVSVHVIDIIHVVTLAQVQCGYG